MDGLGEPDFEGIEANMKNPNVCREGFGTRAVVRATGGGGGAYGQRQKNLKNFAKLEVFINGVQYHQGGHRLLPGPPPTPPTSNY